MFNLPPFQYYFTLWRRSDCIVSPTEVSSTDTIALNTTFDTETNLRIYTSVGTTVTISGSTTRSYYVTSLGTITPEKYTGIDSISVSNSCIISVYAVDESHSSRTIMMRKRRVKGALFGKKRFLAVDEFGRLALMEGQTIVCEPTVGIEVGDILKSDDGTWYEAIEVIPGYDERSRLHHFEVTVNAISADRLRIQ